MPSGWWGGYPRPNQEGPSPGSMSNWLWFILFGILGLIIIQVIAGPAGPKPKDITYEEFLLLADQEKGSANIKKVNVHASRLKLTVTISSPIGKDVTPETLRGVEARKYIVHLRFPYTEELDKRLSQNGFLITAEATGQEDGSVWGRIFWMFGPLVLIALFWIYMMKRATRKQIDEASKIMQSKTTQDTLSHSRTNITFDDIGGIDEAKAEVEEIVRFLRDSGDFTRLGGRIPKGILLTGPAGTGKTLLARAVAREARASFFNLSGSEFVEMFVGVGASRVRDLFARAKKSIPAIIFIDELDAVGKTRAGTPGFYGTHDERDQTLNQILVEMDGLNSGAGIIVMAATNREDVLDSALLRSGRFDRKVRLYLPDIKGREAILKIHTRKLVLAPDIDLKKVAQNTPGFSGADLENVCNEAAIFAGKKKKSAIERKDFEEAIEKVVAGEEQRSRVISLEEKEVTATHEAGHTIVALNIQGADPVHKVSIVPRGRSLGATWQVPEKDHLNASREYLLGQVTVLYGGRVAEEMFLNGISVGAYNDIEHATKILKNMVMRWGMAGENTPILDFGAGASIFDQDTYVFSEDTRKSLDAAITRLSRECYEKARSILQVKKDALLALRNALLEREVLGQDEILKIVGTS